MKKKFLKYIGIGAVGIIVAAAAAFIIHPATRFSLTCTSPCILPEELKLGGNGGAFILAALSMTLQGKRLEVRGVDQCNSACTLLVDHLHHMNIGDPNATCVGDNLVWGTHRAFRERQDGTHELLDHVPVYSTEPLASWIKNNGGLPASGGWLTVPLNIVHEAYGHCLPTPPVGP